MDNLESSFYDRCMWPLERLSLTRLRRHLLSEAEGAVLEVGTGTGVNLSWYPQDVAVTAIDLRPAHLAAALSKYSQNPRGHLLSVACGNAQKLPFADQVFDSVIGTLVFCSIHEPLTALTEIRRVLRPGGRLLLLEHVRGLNPLAKKVTDWLHPVWFALQGECHLNRETAETVAAAGFSITHTSQHAGGVIQIIHASAPHTMI